ncbi:MAG: IS110 family transposase [Actinobacteria bacterium]|nr:IS110 family transposase [Actinomycetota bacterium]
MIYLGIDWAERHHDACVMDEAGAVLATSRVPEGVEGVAKLHEMASSFAEEPSEVIVGIETDRGLLVEALIATGYRVYAINPMAASRYRDRHHVAGTKSDPGDAKVLADLVRTDRHNHREVAGDSTLAEAIKVLARAHQRLVWTRGRQTNQLRSTLREYYPGALEVFTDLHSPDALAVLAVAPTPELGRGLSVSKVRRVLERAGRQRNLDRRSAEIVEGLRAPQLEAPGIVAEAFGATVVSIVAIVQTLNTEIARLQEELAGRFEVHPDAEILTSLPGLGSVLGARVLAEFGDDPTRYADARARRNYAGTAPITRASGTRRVVLARVARNKRLADAIYLWAFSSLQASRGARAFYDRQRTAGKTHHQALRTLGNRWVGILHGCLAHRSLYDEDIAWATRQEIAA